MECVSSHMACSYDYHDRPAFGTVESEDAYAQRLWEEMERKRRGQHPAGQPSVGAGELAEHAMPLFVDACSSQHPRMPATPGAVCDRAHVTYLWRRGT